MIPAPLCKPVVDVRARHLSCLSSLMLLLNPYLSDTSSFVIECRNLADGHLLSCTGLHGSRASGGNGRLTGLLLEDLPELERLIGSRGGEHLTIGAEAAVENARLVSRDLHVLNTGGVAPDAQAVVGEATSADNLLVVGAPAKAGDLRVGGNVVDAGTSGGVPEVDLTVVGTTTGGKQVGLPWAP